MRRPLCLFSLAFAAALAIFIRMFPPPAPAFEAWDGQTLLLEGQVYKKECRNESLILYLTSNHILYQWNQSVSLSEEKLSEEKIQNVQCYINEGPEPPLGSKVRIEGELRCFEEASNPGEFDLRQYYRIMKIDFKMENARLLSCRAYGFSLREGLYRIRRFFAGNLERCFGEKEAGIMKAVLLGDKGSLDSEIKELYKRSGILHILAVSGLHISVIGMGFYRLLRRVGLSVKCSVPPAAGWIWCYGIMTGMSPSSIRAILMFSLYLTAEITGRSYDRLSAAAFAAVLLLLEQPLYIGYSGFLFSFGAVTALGMLPELLGKEEKKAKGKAGKAWRKKIKQAVLAGTAVTLATLPVQLTAYFEFPVYSVFLNLLILPLMPAVMYAGIFCMLFGSLLPLAAGIMAYPAAGILRLYEKLCLLFEELPGGRFVAGRPQDWQIAVYIIFLFVLSLLGKRLSDLWKTQGLILALVILLARNTEGLAVTVLDVGQGEGIHIQCDGKNYLIDGGSTTDREVGKRRLLPYLKAAGVRNLEAVFLTHADEDHCNGIRTLLEEAGKGDIGIGCLILPDVAADSRDGAFEQMVEAAEAGRVPVRYMSRGGTLQDGGLKLTCLHPYAGFETARPNEYSLVLYLEYGDFSGLFTGDVEGRGEEELLWYLKERETGRKKLTLLKAAHHGSGNSTDEEILRLLSPGRAFISCGKNNRYGHPAQELLDRLERNGCIVYITKDSGAVTAYTDGKRMRIRTFR